MVNVLASIQVQLKTQVIKMAKTTRKQKTFKPKKPKVPPPAIPKLGQYNTGDGGY
jgi:hypothetical protein